jgi:hypothetical protein
MNDNGNPTPLRNAARLAVDASCMDLWHALEMMEALCSEDLTGLECDIQELLAEHPSVASDERKERPK